jgi:AcrR family transcriptional regulator
VTTLGVTAGPDPSAGLRERKKRWTRRALEDVALELFVAKGFDATTIDEIAGAVEVSPRTFFRYFPSKEDVVFTHAAGGLARLLRTLRAQPATLNHLTALRNAFVAIGEGIERNRDTELLRARLIVGHSALWARALETQAQWEHEIARELAHRAGTSAPDADLTLLTVVALSANRVAFDRWRDGYEDNLPVAIRGTFEGLPKLFRRSRSPRQPDERDAR